MSELSDKFYADIPGLTIWDQKNTPSCVAHTTASMMQQIWHTKTGKIVPFSPRFLHILSMDWRHGPNDGRDIKAVFEVARRFGCCTEKLLPNDTSLSNEEYCNKALITQEMLDEASKYKLVEYQLKSINLNRNQNFLSRISNWVRKAIHPRPNARGTIGGTDGYNFQVYSDDHGKHFHVKNEEKGIDARFSFPEIELIDYKRSEKTLRSKDIHAIKKYFFEPQNFKRLELEFIKRELH